MGKTLRIFSKAMWRYYTIIDFNGVDMMIYLPEKVIFTEAARPRCTLNKISDQALITLKLIFAYKCAV